MAFTFPLIFLMVKWTFFSIKFKAHINCVSYLFILKTKRNADYGPAYRCNDPQHCSPVALTDCTWTRPWKAALTLAHPWANHKAVQNNGLLLQLCHLRGRCVQQQQQQRRNTSGGLFGHDHCGYTTPSGHGRWNWNGREQTKAGIVSPLRMHLIGSQSLIPLKYVDCVHNIHNRNTHPLCHRQMSRQRPRSDNAMSGIRGAHVFD